MNRIVNLNKKLKIFFKNKKHERKNIRYFKRFLQVVFYIYEC